MTRDPHNLLNGGCATWQLPTDPSCAPFGRSVLRTALTALALPDDLIDNGTLAVSETTTNAWQHGSHSSPCDPIVAPELWLWARLTPTPQLVVTVFDAGRDWQQTTEETDPLTEGGRGIGIVASITDDAGTHWSRSRVNTFGAQGKAVWFALPLPCLQPRSDLTIDPAHAAARLRALLGARGIHDVHLADQQGVSLVSLPAGLNVWVEPKTFTFNDTDGTRIRRPLLDLQDVAEHLVRRTEESTALGRLPEHPAEPARPPAG